MTKQQYKEKIKQGGCIICGQPGEIHHPRFSTGLARKESDYLGICLCAWHHRTGPFGQARHNGKATFGKNYGTDAALLAETIKKIMGGI